MSFLAMIPGSSRDFGRVRIRGVSQWESLSLRCLIPIIPVMNRMFVILILLLGSGAFAQEVRENYNGVRSLGMGGASVAVVNDETALLSNPAGLGKLRDAYGTIFDPEIEGGMNLSEMYRAKAFTSPFGLSQVKDTLDASRNSYYHFKGQLFPSFVVKNFGIGLYGKRVLDAEMNADGTQMQTFYQDDLALHMGFNLRFFDGRVKIGAVGKIISRIEIDKALDPAGDLSIKPNASEGVGIGSDIGIIMTAPVASLPTIAAVVRDVGGTAFTAGSNLRMETSTRPNQVDQDMDVALAFFPIHKSKARSTVTFEYQKIKAASEATDKMKYAHVGYEYNSSDLFFLRAGYNQRYWTAGVELASENTQIQLASYGEEIGTQDAPREDRRLVFKFSFRY